MNQARIYSNSHDEYYTPRYAVAPILKYLKPKSTIWCPFDTAESYYVKLLTEAGHTVVHTHIHHGQDFFKLNVPCDYIISNPPYSLKTEVLERLFELGKPFAMLVGIVGIFDSKKRSELFRDKPFEVLYLSPRVAFLADYDGTVLKSLPFQSGYICSGILSRQIMFEVIKKS